MPKLPFMAVSSGWLPVMPPLEMGEIAALLA